MKILIIISDGKPGGGTTFVQHLLEGLARKHDCYFVSDVNSYACKLAKQTCQAVLGLPFFEPGQLLENRKRLKELIQVVNPDVIHVNGSRALWLLRLIAVQQPVVYTVHGYHHQQGSLLKAFMGKQLERWATTCVTAQVFVSEHDQKLARHHALTHVPMSQQYCIYNGIDLTRVASKGRTSPGKLLGFVGRFEKPKHPLFMLEVIRKLAPEGYRLLMVGDGTLMPEIVDRVQEYGLWNHVILAGACSQQEALNMLQPIDLLVMPSKWEALGISAIEAQAAGVPVIASHRGGLPEAIQNGVTGVLLEDFDAQIYADTTQAVLSDKVRYAAMSAEARQWVQGQFDQVKMVDKYLSLFQSLK